ncbi:MAG: YciE/YciF ferroxidase family protein [Glycocaulis sp.]|uniref:YciE/YciF ferroxidase family protein n=1 Tax=Glycocaulis sp. TaxID=1969725 RepID=UPI003F70F3C3
MSIKTKEDLFIHGLRDIYYAEKRIVNALPKMADKVDNTDLKAAFQTHKTETEEQVRRLEKVFEQLGKKAEGEECPAIEGIIDEAEELMDEIKDKDVLTAALLAGAQAVEHYEIARYGTLCEWASELGHEDSRKLLEETLEEEKNTDKKLTKLAESQVNKQAA